MKPRSNGEIAAALFAALQRGHKTRFELEQSASVSKGTVDRFVVALKDQGVVYVAERRPQNGRGKPVEVIALNAVPFGNEDAPRTLRGVRVA